MPRDLSALPTSVRLEQLGKVYAAGGRQIEALHQIDLAVGTGEVFGIIGRSGAGKSTLIRTINRLEAPSSGRVLVQGQDVAGLDTAGLIALRRRTGMIFQHFNLLSAKTVAQNIALPLRVAGVPRDRAAVRVAELLELVGLTDKRDAYPARLSGGQKQRVGIARALVHGPELLLCDEATSALDPETTQSILALLRRINRELGLTIILITHEMAVIRALCDRVAVLEQGRLVEQGEVWRVFGAPRHAATRALLRPLAEELPADLAERLRPGAGTAPRQETLLALHVSGAAGPGPSLSRLAALLGPEVTLLHGGVDRIQAHAQGRLLLSLRGLPEAWPEHLAALRAEGHEVEVLGHVAAA